MGYFPTDSTAPPLPKTAPTNYALVCKASLPTILRPEAWDYLKHTLAQLRALDKALEVRVDRRIEFTDDAGVHWDIPGEFFEAYMRRLNETLDPKIFNLFDTHEPPK